jgi:predicted NAD/FAD-binding protein
MDAAQRRIAVVGSGISGLASAWLLKRSGTR